MIFLDAFLFGLAKHSSPFLTLKGFSWYILHFAKEDCNSYNIFLVVVGAYFESVKCTLLLCAFHSLLFATLSFSQSFKMVLET